MAAFSAFFCKTNLKKNIDQMNKILAFMKRKGVQVEQLFQNFYEEEKQKNKIIEHKSVKKGKNVEKNRKIP